MIGKTFCLIISIYQRVHVRLMPPVCRYWPTCSHYAIEAIRTHGPWKGAWLGLKRILRCHPWAQGGHDPVPPARGTTPPATKEDP